MRILSVDDKLENRYRVEALLKGHGFEVVSASNGAEALELLEKEEVDCVITSYSIHYTKLYERDTCRYL